MRARSKAVVKMMLGGLVLISSIVSVCCGPIRQLYIADWVSNDECFFKHPEPTEELTGDQLIDGLREIGNDPGLFLNIKTEANCLFTVYRILDLLYNTKKDSSVLLGTLTVRQLVKLNNFELENCSKKGFRERGEIFAQLASETLMSVERAVLERYLQVTLYELIKYCKRRHYEVVKRGYNTRDWLEKLLSLVIDRSRWDPLLWSFQHRDLLNYITKPSKSIGQKIMPKQLGKWLAL